MEQWELVCSRRPSSGHRIVAVVAAKASVVLPVRWRHPCPSRRFQKLVQIAGRKSRSTPRPPFDSSGQSRHSGAASRFDRGRYELSGVFPELLEATSDRAISRDFAAVLAAMGFAEASIGRSVAAAAVVAAGSAVEVLHARASVAEAASEA